MLARTYLFLERWGLLRLWAPAWCSLQLFLHLFMPERVAEEDAAFDRLVRRRRAALERLRGELLVRRAEAHRLVQYLGGCPDVSDESLRNFLEFTVFELEETMRQDLALLGELGP